MRAVVARPFYVRWGGPVFRAGDEFDGPDEQVAALAAMGLVEASGAESGPDSAEVEQVPNNDADGEDSAATSSQVPLSSLTAAQLRALCAERGIRSDVQPAYDGLTVTAR